MRGRGLCLDESEIDLGSPRLALQTDTSGFTRAKLPICLGQLLLKVVQVCVCVCVGGGVIIKILFILNLDSPRT